ncbi:conserved hypothetical protein [Crenothrix polyspora]|jgi:hypothetical protein|uniref:Uncharacterized protein n=1 Tax=Crenothrix polyspora TaxID=360316 RepID=A0A1R4HC04_9GAMM|nr:hypothetical protein [Crenothrix polyspora]SJM93706.1 conserved hypothetical protein [Crenothrix polyspora]
MNRNHITRALNQVSHNELSRETAIYEAAHATAIYLGNKQRHLPPIFFQISITHDACGMDNEWIAKIDGGRLIHTLPSSIAEATRDFTDAQKQAYQLAFEADIINLLVGPLAEAKYVALRDHTPINPCLIPIQPLQYYGETSDLHTVREYLECFITEKTERISKIAELFFMALSFINNPSHWQAIVALTDYILRVGKDSIDCEEAGFIITQQAC